MRSPRIGALICVLLLLRRCPDTGSLIVAGYRAGVNAAPIWILNTHDQFIAQLLTKGNVVAIETGGGTTSRIWVFRFAAGEPGLILKDVVRGTCGGFCERKMGLHQRARSIRYPSQIRARRGILGRSGRCNTCSGGPILEDRFGSELGLHRQARRIRHQTPVQLPARAFQERLGAGMLRMRGLAGNFHPRKCAFCNRSALDVLHH